MFPCHSSFIIFFIGCASFSVSTRTYHRRLRKSSTFSKINPTFSPGVFFDYCTANFECWYNLCSVGYSSIDFLLFSARRFLSSTAHQFLRFEQRWLTNLSKYGILTAEEKTWHGVNRLVTLRYEFAIIAAWVLDRIVAWPQFWPSTELDYMETVLTRALESTVFGLKSIEKSWKSRKKSVSFCLGARCCRFESCHFDQKEKGRARAFPFSFCRKWRWRETASSLQRGVGLKNQSSSSTR